MDESQKYVEQTNIIPKEQCCIIPFLKSKREKEQSVSGDRG